MGSSHQHYQPQEEDEEASIVADVDAILNDTDRIVGHIDDALAGKPVRVTALAAKRKLDELDILEATAAPQNGGGEKRKPKVQCEECYEVFEDDEKLAWHALNDH